MASRFPRTNLQFAALACLALNAGFGAPAAAPRDIEFNRDIRPILSDKCFFCHGPDANRRKGKLRLDSREEATQRGIIKPGDPDHSSLISRIMTDDPDELMPPGDSHKRLSAEEKELYTWWQRTFLHPSLLAFDAPSREECVAERSRSNISQQALALLNDPSFVETYRAFAARILRECAGTVDQRVAWAWHQVLQRDPDSNELLTARQLLERQLADYIADPGAASRLLIVGLSRDPDQRSPDRIEPAAWTHLARVLLNPHETITRP